MIKCKMHPGKHHQTRNCEGVTEVSRGARLLDWLEHKLNPKQGRPAPTCPSCKNSVIIPNRCIYCGRML